MSILERSRTVSTQNVMRMLNAISVCRIDLCRMAAVERHRKRRFSKVGGQMLRDSLDAGNYACFPGITVAGDRAFDPCLTDYLGTARRRAARDWKDDGNIHNLYGFVLYGFRFTFWCLLGLSGKEKARFSAALDLSWGGIWRGWRWYLLLLYFHTVFFGHDVDMGYLGNSIGDGSVVMPAVAVSFKEQHHMDHCWFVPCHWHVVRKPGAAHKPPMAMGVETCSRFRYGLP